MDGTIEQWEAYWNSDDALLRSETGLPGASNAELIYRYCGDSNPWPPTSQNPYWIHSNAWWIQWDVFNAQIKGLTETEKYASFVALSQELQANGLAIAANSCKSRFPQCGGFILWMGHDAFPCLANTSIIDYEGNPKPAYYALKKIFLDEYEDPELVVHISAHEITL
jgi:beta-mannosidase